MKIDPITISIAALTASFLSLIISTYRAAVDRRLQWEQIRGDMQSRLTSRGVELLTLIEELNRFPGDETSDLIRKLIRIADGMVNIRQRLKEMKTPPWFYTSVLVTEVAPIKSELDEAEPVFDKLRSEIMGSHFPRASLTADGLIQRLYGSETKN